MCRTLQTLSAASVFLSVNKTDAQEDSDNHHKWSYLLEPAGYKLQDTVACKAESKAVGNGIGHWHDDNGQEGRQSL